MRPQRTIADSVHVEGFGYWSGQDVRVEFRPAPPGSGLVFVRGDLPTPVHIPAAVGHRIEVPRRTNLAAHGVQVEMVEHVLAACAGLRVDNCEIWVNRSELPGCDGSSLAFSQALRSAGIVEQAALRRQLVVTDVLRVGDTDSWVEARPNREAALSLHYQLDYAAHPAIGRQQIKLTISPDLFQKELAPARTFLLQEEADAMRRQGLGRRVSCRDLLVFDEQGPIDNQLRFDNECVRHKALDLVGDFALAGCDIVGQVIAYRSGHRLNAEMIRLLLAEGELFTEKRKTA